MAAIDFKKTQKQYYQVKNTPELIDVPEMAFIAIDGIGDPNTAAAYAEAIEILYGLSYAIKMGNKDIMEYVVLPLEGYWNNAGPANTGTGTLDKDRFEWTAMIRQPDFVTQDVFAEATQSLAKKKPQLDLAKARLERITEGLCIQILHNGSYDDEPATIAAIYAFAEANGYLIDLNETRRHHEIYLSDPRKTAPEKLKTVIRYPVKPI